MIERHENCETLASNLFQGCYCERLITPANGGGQPAPKPGKEGEEKQVKLETGETGEIIKRRNRLNWKQEKMAFQNMILMLHSFSLGQPLFVLLLWTN